ncbi:MAG: VOC family protein [Deltaproteobacteria bacterium]|nr:VOC family protein [Deltaproteobacteria bacterium]
MGDDTLRIKATGIDHMVVHVEDVARAKRFYVDLLGMEVAHEHDGRVFLRCGQQQLGLFKARQPLDPSAGRDLNHVALQVESGSYEEVKAALEASGVAVSGRRGDPRCIYFRDPDGHQVQILAPRT